MLRLISLFLLSAISLPALATNGYFAHGYGIQSRAMGGAGIALPQDTLIMATNPAGLSLIEDRFDATAALFSPRRSYEVSGNPSPPPNAALAPGKVRSDRNYFVLPEMGISKRLNDRITVGAALFGNGGMNTSYSSHIAPNGTFGAGKTGVDLAQLFITPSVAYQFDNGASIGASAILAYQWFEIKGINSFAGFSTSPSNLSDNGHDYAFGAGVNIGFMLPVGNTVTLGGHYRSKVYMQEFDDYRGLFAEQGDFDVPATATIGVAWKASNAVTLALDVQRIWYGDIDAIGNGILPAFGQCMMGQVSSCLGGDNGVGFGWDDITTIKLGAKWEAANDWTWRVGYSVGDQPIPSSEVFFNILAPGVMRKHITAGFTKKFDNGKQAIHFAAMYAPSESVRGFISPTQSVELEMKQYQLELGWTKLF